MNYATAIIIPLYKKQLNEFENLAITQCFNILSNHKIIAIKPESLSLENYKYEFDEIISFDNEYFSNIAGYNRLMMSTEFYERFLDYKHILIYQTDAFVFKDELRSWCQSGYDYIGAPWVKDIPYPDFVKRIKSQYLNYIHRKRNVKDPGTDLPAHSQLENRVGNGGFSLRNTKKFLEICIKESELIAFYNSRNEHQFGEDVFWGIEVNRKKTQLKIPNYKIAVKFAMENNLIHAFLITNGNLPFGCHAWDRNLDYWRPIFKKIGFNI